MTVADLARFETAEESKPSADSFGELLPFSASRIEAPALPPDLLPTPLREWNVDIAERLQVPLEMVAAPAIVSLGALIGRRIGIRPKVIDDWLIVPNLWGGIVARPGMLKSPTLTASLDPIRHLADAARVRHEQRMDELGARRDALRAKEAGIKDRIRNAHKKGDTDDSPEALEQSLVEVRREIREQEKLCAEPRYVVNDSTVEKLGELFRTNPQGLLLERDELAGWLRSLDREDRKSDRELFLEAWNGTNPYIYDRIGRGTIQIPALCLSIIGGIQPPKLQTYVAEGIAGGWAADGLVQRFQILVWPEQQRGWKLVDKAPDNDAREQILERMRHIDGLPVPDGEVEIPALRFEPGAQELFLEWWTTLEHRLRSPELQQTPAFESHLAKYRSLMPSLSLIFHLLTSSSDLPVSITAARLGADWCEFLEQHARKVYRAEIEKGFEEAFELAKKIRDGSVVSGMTLREIYKHGWARLKNADQVASAVSVLAEHGWARIHSKRSSGRPSPALVLHPDLLATIDSLLLGHGAK